MQASSGEADSLSSLLGDRVRRGLLGSSLTTLAIGGPLEGFLELDNLEELVEIRRKLSASGLQHRILGAGSNILMSSQGLSGLTLRLGRGFRTFEVLGSGRVRVGGSYSLMALSRTLSGEGLSGLEFAGGIPASIGGAVAMNAGAHHGQMADVIERVGVVLPDGTTLELRAKELSFSYRRSLLPPGAIVHEVVFEMVQGNAQRSAELRQKYLSHRKQTQPLQSPSAGSIFKNPSADRPAGRLLEEAGMKGVSLGQARVSDLHANWIVNDSRKATDLDVQELIRRCQQAVQKAHSIELEPEVLHWT